MASGQDISSVVQNVGKILKVLLLSLGLFSSVVMLKGTFLPFSCEFVVGFWNSLRCFLSSPLYICIIINSMVLLIAALSNFHHPDPPPPPQPPGQQPLPPPQKLPRTEKCSTPSFDLDHDGDYFSADHVSSEEQLDEGEEKEEDDTMEATWKAISGGKAKQLTKSETFVQTDRLLHSEEIPAASLASTWKDLKKWETFNEAVSIRRRGGMRRDPSVGIDEFNQKVEAFIKKFNDDMRLQRQESDQRFIDMIKRGL
ncbi:hypothetical protein ACS0TY_007264 [Phlomoides rotata]